MLEPATTIKTTKDARVPLARYSQVKVKKFVWCKETIISGFHLGTNERTNERAGIYLFWQ